jgi:hypothetical protein
MCRTPQAIAVQQTGFFQIRYRSAGSPQEGLYYNMCLKTLTEREVFTAHKISPVQLHRRLLEFAPTYMAHIIGWEIDWSKPHPYSYSCPKAKNDFTTARPVISFYKSTCDKILKATAGVLFEVTKNVCNTNLHIDEVHNTFRKLNAFISQI